MIEASASWRVAELLERADKIGVVKIGVEKTGAEDWCRENRWRWSVVE
jgi:hypothetical protein